MGRAVLSLSLLLSIASFCGPVPVGAAIAGDAGESLVERERSLGVMGTDLVLRAFGPDGEALDTALDAAIAELQRVEDRMTDWRPSPLTRPNGSTPRSCASSNVPCVWARSPAGPSM